MSVPHLVIRVNDPVATTTNPSENRLATPSQGGHSTTAPSASPSARASGSPPVSAGAVNTSAPAPIVDDDEVDELRDDEPTPPLRVVAPPAATLAPPAPSPKPSGGGSKSRKSSCDLCHHRKIKCDQVRPSCSSCMRKGHPCHYSEETEANNPHSNGRRAAVEVPKPLHLSQGPRASFGTPGGPNGNAGSSSPAWLSSGASRPKSGASRPNSAAGGSIDRKKKLDRDRIVNGYGSSSDEGEDDDKSNTPSGSGGKARDVENDLADMLGEKDDEVDELDSADEATKGSVSSRGKKRDASVDDELSGELLELASAPPKKKKARPSVPEAVPRLSSAAAQSVAQTAPPARPRNAPPLSSSSHTASSAASRYDGYSMPLVTLMASLPSAETQSILFNTSFSDPFLTEGISLLQPQFVDDFHSLVERRASNKLREGDATTLANAFTFLAVALRVLPEETSKLLLASGTTASSNAPRSVGRIVANQPASAADPTPLDQRYFELALLAAQIAEQRDAPSVMYVVHKLVLFRYATLGFRKDRLVLAGGWLAQAIKTAQALGMSKEWEGIPQGERELRRRVMWSLYIADRQFSFETAFPYTILDAHQGIHLPSPISEQELYKIAPDSPTLPPHSTENGPTACTALFIHTHLTRRITPILDSFVTVGPSGTPHDLVLRFDASLDAFQEALPPYLRLFPLTDTRYDSAHSYLAPHRVRLHSTLLSYRLGVHRAHLASYLLPNGSPGVRAVIAQVCLASLRCQKSAKMLDPKLSPRLFSAQAVFEAAATLALIMYVERAVAGPSNQQSIAQSSEYLSMRAGVADGTELLDNVSSASDAGSFARVAVRVLREVIAKVDAGPRSAAASTTSPAAAGAANGSTGSLSPAAVHRDTRDASPSSNPYLVAVGQWLDSWRAAGISVEYLLREADWPSWEKVIAGM
ncbi:hypothetical protein VHUM_01815 [Vanrija humicola]|uniref:Zn(2)-C6 fungal-type domain-containing protein n=1 Tax=Vanrija humicola TaxID=5417 RepID=A0A7D8ZS05_VANHU|nr:hypothetical protein VHUM_01815 [Vanrija humicola]